MSIDTQLGKPSFTFKQVHRAFTTNERHKAKALASNGHVTITDIIPNNERNDAPGYQIYSRVIGSRGQPYEQELQLYFEYGQWEVDGFCTCPMDYNCKHVAAVLNVIDKEHRLVSNTGKEIPASVSDADALDQWLRDVGEDFIEASTPQEHKAKPKNKSSYLIVYRLEHAPNKEWHLQIFKARQLKSGELSNNSFKSTPLHSLLHNHFSSYIDLNHDPDIFACLESCGIAMRFQHERNDSSYQYQPYGYGQTTTLKGELGFTALHKMLASGRLFWGGFAAGHTLRLGKEQSVAPQWQLTNDGDQQLILCDQYALDAVLPVTPLMGFDQGQGVLFPLITDLSMTQLHKLMKAPLISPKESLSLPKQSQTVFERSKLPAPQAVQVKAYKRKRKPVIQLQLSGMSNDNHNPTLNGMTLCFSYPNCAAIPYNKEGKELSYWHDGILHKLPRHEVTENSALQTLTKLGAKPLRALYPNGIDLNIEGIDSALGFASLSDWYDFMLQGLNQLEAAGWNIDRDDNFNLEFVDADEWYADLDSESQNDWFNLAIGIQIDGEAINLLPILLPYLRGSDLSQELQRLRDQPKACTPISLDDGRHVALPNERILPVLETFVELFDEDTLLDDDGRLSLAKAQAGRLAQISGTDWRWNGGDKLRRLAQKIANFAGVKTVTPPTNFLANLRDYQQQGLDWLQFLREYELGGILADDMGLGKTIQTLAQLCCEKASGRLDKPSLIVAPTSLVGNWKREAERFAPDLNILALQGPDRKPLFDLICQQDLVITTYALLKHDDAVLNRHEYYYLILDEAQNIKNPRSKSSLWVRNCRAQHKLCLTGTPMENHLGELWSLYDFLMPGMLGGHEEFTRLYRTPIEKHSDSEKHSLLVKRIAPFMLRRNKQEVVTELPKKTEINRSIELTDKQRDLYETIRLAMDKKVQQEIAKKGLAKSHIMILDALLKLRQVCCHPQLLSLSKAKNIQQSNKLDMLMEMLPEMVEEGRRILLFSQFTSMLTLIENALLPYRIPYVKLTGQSRKRDEVIQRFQTGEVPLFLISLKAGGVGLNLTAADTVIHYDPWWNPAVEDQATDRAYRIGQDKPVFVYKLTTENTVEAKILAMQERKRALAEGTYGKKPRSGPLINETDLKELFKPL